MKASHPRILEVLASARHVLGPRFKLSSLNARSINPGCLLTQPLHADMSALPDDDGFWVFNSLWMLDDFTPDNGALRYVPGTHHRHALPADELDDPLADHPDQQPRDADHRSSQDHLPYPQQHPKGGDH
mgnify:CR=1 FL=1